MSLIQTSLITGFFLAFLGFLILKPKSRVHSSLQNFPRSKTCSLWFVGIATIWFLWRHVAFLSEADFGNYKILIGTIAFATAILSFRYVPDFLSVRGLAMLVLLWSREVLDSAFLHEAGTRLVLVAIIYALISLAIYFGAWPYKMNELLEWLYEKSLRISLLGWILASSGLSIILLSFTY